MVLTTRAARAAALAAIAGLTLATGAALAAYDVSFRGTVAKPPRTELAEGYRDDLIIVKFLEGVDIQLDGERFSSRANNDFAAAEQVRTQFGAEVRHLVTLAESRVEMLRLMGESRVGQPLPDMNLYYEWTVPDHQGAAAADALNRLSTVELAYPAPDTTPPPTPDFREYQTYMRPATDGIDPAYAWNQPGGRGEGVFLIDIEWDWYDLHEDLEAARGRRFVFQTRGQFADHGAAVLGELLATDDDKGVTGMVPGVAVGLVSDYPSGMTYDVARAIVAALDYLEPGDVLLLEAQVGGPTGAYAPVEWNQAEFDAILLATARGITVVEAAGNGGANLDAPEFLGRFDRSVRDSGAIIVGAGYSAESPSDRSRLSFSCYGSRLDLQGWGERVMTTGYGNFYRGEIPFLQDYTRTFNGTSSASPFVAAAAVSLQGTVKGRSEPILSPTEVRDLLVQTGSPQQPGPFSGQIGPRPDLKAAIRARPGLYYDRHTLDPNAAAFTLSVCLYNAYSASSSSGTIRIVNEALPPWVQAPVDTAVLEDILPGETGCTSSSAPITLTFAPDAPGGTGFRLPLDVQTIFGAERAGIWIIVPR